MKLSTSLLTSLAQLTAVATACTIPSKPSPPSPPSSSPACNGHQELCGRKYSAITFIGSHDSAFVGRSITHNQYISVAAQLDYGVRFLQAQTRDKDGVIEMCHTLCLLLDQGTFEAYLREIAGWLRDKPNEVVSLLLTNPDNIPLDKFDAAFASTGLKELAFRPKKKRMAKDEWPTLQEFIDDNSRLLVFMDYHADLTKVDYIMDEFSYFWETPYGVTDSNFPTCAVDRPKGGDPSQLMGIMNHMLNNRSGVIVYPNQPAAPTTNSIPSIQKQVQLCKGQWSEQPNVVLLDYINVGQAAEAQLMLNNLTDA
ncbi:hypothetical protein K4F52_007878 [Lecanicillium sp. MT-2017a]|nr:hypothetical protein K4F52_007878 [Lecanicillium sp. MT-2017a]